MLYRIVMIFMLVMAGAGNSLHAAAPPNFSGTWKLDLDAAETIPLDPLLEAQGVPWLQRQAADTMPMTQVITQTDKTLTIRTSTAIGERTTVMKLDGGTQMIDTEAKAGKVLSRSFWDKNKPCLITVSSFTTRDGQKAEWTIRRYLQDEGRTLVVDHELVLEDGRKLHALRILRKQ